MWLAAVADVSPGRFSRSSLIPQLIVPPYPVTHR
jgi:hypothetical protein